MDDRLAPPAASPGSPQPRDCARALSTLSALPDAVLTELPAWMAAVETLEGLTDEALAELPEPIAAALVAQMARVIRVLRLRAARAQGQA